MSNFIDRMNFLLKKFGGNAKFSRLCDISSPTISGSIGKGVKKPAELSRKNLEKIVRATGCDANWLLTGRGEPFPVSQLEQTELTRFSGLHGSETAQLLIKLKYLIERQVNVEAVECVKLNINMLYENYKKNEQNDCSCNSA